MGPSSKKDGSSKPSTILKTTCPYCALIEVLNPLIGIDRRDDNNVKGMAIM